MYDKIVCKDWIITEIEEGRIFEQSQTGNLTFVQRTLSSPLIPDENKEYKKEKLGRWLVTDVEEGRIFERTTTGKLAFVPSSDYSSVP